MIKGCIIDYHQGATNKCMVRCRSGIYDPPYQRGSGFVDPIHQRGCGMCDPLLEGVWNPHLLVA